MKNLTKGLIDTMKYAMRINNEFVSEIFPNGDYDTTLNIEDETILSYSQDFLSSLAFSLRQVNKSLHSVPIEIVSIKKRVDKVEQIIEEEI